MGRTIEDVRALVLTHGHSDHIGFAERLRTEQDIPVSVHEADASLARGEVPNPSKGFGPTKVGPLVGFLWFSLLRGGLRTRHLGQVSTFGDGATLDVPGSPVVTLTPGHTPGSAVLHFRSPGALLITIAAWNAMNGQQGGDPAKLANALVQLASQDEPPLRWVAGTDAVELVEKKAKDLLAQAEAYRELSSSLAHDDDA
jgi:glyoxylase-like metal-dependent hydrolase (beta-lactamase superfamily II)